MTAGALRGGRETFVTMKLPNAMVFDGRDGSKDRTEFYLAALNSHGSSAFRCLVTPIRLTSHRDRSLLGFYLSSGARPSELLGLTNGLVRWDEQTITVVRKGTRALQRIPAAPDAFVWFSLYQAALPAELTAPDQPAWWTLRKPHRQLNYDAMRAVVRRANEALGSNWSLHDLRHTAAMRMQDDPNMRLSDIQTILGHTSIVTTQKYLRPREVEVFEHAQAHFRRLRERATSPGSDKPPSGVGAIAVGYSADDMNELFGGGQCHV